MLKFGIEFVPETAYWQVCSYGILAEKFDFDTLWITDHFNNRNVYMILTLIANQTNKIKLGPGVTNPYLTNPVVTGSTMMTLNNMSGGRAILGIGAGDAVTFGYLGVEWKRPLSAIRESVKIIRQVTSGKKVEYEGRVFNVKGARVSYSTPSTIPVYIGAQGPKMLALSGKIGDGVLINASHPRDFEYAITQVRKGIQEAGRKIEDIDVCAYASVSVDKNAEKAKKKAVPVVAFIAAGSPPPILERHGIPVDDAMKIKSMLTQGNFPGAFEAVTDGMIDAFNIYGTPAEVTEKVKGLMKTGITHFIVGSPIGPVKRQSMELISKEVLPHFRK